MFRTNFALLVVTALTAGCQPLSPSASQSLATPAGLGGDIEPRDDDTFTGRLKTSTRQMTGGTTDRQEAQQKALAKERVKQQQAAAKRAKPKSGLSSWLFPEPKQPRTLSEWLSQDRPAS